MNQDHKHRCKFCRKIFPCGRSLGGHMRSHVLPSPAAANGEEKLEASRGMLGFGANGYGLRENPKKTWRFSPPPSRLGGGDDDEREKQCRECSKKFQSWKALFGHMRCHAGKIKLQEGGGGEGDEEEEEDQGSSGGSHIDRAPKKKKPRSARASSSSASECCYHSKEQEDVAISLMLLSRDIGPWGCHFDEFSDKNSAVFEDHQDFASKGKNLELDVVSDDDSDRYFESEANFVDYSSLKKKTVEELDGDATKSKSKYKCTTCNKGFHTYQALGGHRASHKRMRGCYEAGASSLIDHQEIGNETIVKTKGNHQCLVCGKVFGSGQALGGHKRSHLVMATPSVVIHQQDLLDLNLPAPIDEDSSKGSVSIAAVEYDSWWAGSNLQNEAMVTMIAN